MTADSPASILWRVGLVALLILSCLLVESRGTLDVHTWERWTQDYLTHGPFAGYAISHTDYPPLMAFIFYLSSQTLSIIGVSTFLAIKLTVLVFEFLTAGIIFYWTRRVHTCVFFLAAFLLDAVLLGYSDVILGFFLLLAFYAAQKNQWLLLSLTSVIAVFIKWQALIVMPFLLFSVLAHEGVSRKLFVQGVVPALVLCAGIVLLFDPQHIWANLHWAMHHHWLSANAENFPWLLTFAYRVFSPESFGGLQHGEITLIATDQTPLVFQLSRGLFLLLYAFIVAAFCRSDKQITALLQYSLLGYLVYFVFNTGVHENHLFLAVMLSLLLAYHDTRWRSLAIYLALALNVNLLLSYGVTGHASLPHVIAQTVDITLVFAALNTLVCIALVWRWVILRESCRSSGSETQTPIRLH